MKQFLFEYGKYFVISCWCKLEKKKERTLTQFPYHVSTAEILGHDRQS